MATLKDHQNAMVDLLANGSAIPASAARLAHALHDVLGLMLERDSGPRGSRVSEQVDGSIQDVRLAADLAMGPRHRDAQNIDNLRAELVAVRHNHDAYKARCESLEAEVAKRAKDYDDVKEALRTQREVNDRLKASLDTWKLRA